MVKLLHYNDDVVSPSPADHLGCGGGALEKIVKSQGCPMELWIDGFEIMTGAWQ